MMYNSMILQSPSLVFRVQRCKPELVAPAKPTPQELKPLSDIDDQDGLRFQIPFILFYPYQPSMAGKDHVQVIRKALAQTLVFYYPFAGRLQEGPGRKLMVDCNGEGVLFIEADADVTLNQFGDALHPPFPCFEELLHDVPGSEGIINCPLLLIQATRLKCGGFILALRLNHAMSDGPGLVQFLKAMAQISKGASKPSILPVWHRELLSARNPPRVTCIHREYEQLPHNPETIFKPMPPKDIVHRSFFFGPTQIAALRRLVPHHPGRSTTTFEVLTACLWRCRTRALHPPPEEEVRLMCPVSVHTKLKPPLPVGYNGNGFMLPAAVTTSGKLCENPFGYALELIKKAKATVDEEYVHSVADLMVIKGRPHYTVVGSLLVSDLTRAVFKEVDFGWGMAVYGGPAKGGTTLVPEMTSLYIAFEKANGEKGTAVSVSLSAQAMERFEGELDDMLTSHALPSPPQTISSL